MSETDSEKSRRLAPLKMMILIAGIIFMAGMMFIPLPVYMRVIFAFCMFVLLVAALFVDKKHKIIDRAIHNGPGQPEAPLSDFQHKAHELSRTIHTLAEKLGSFESHPLQQEYIHGIAENLVAGARTYDQAVFELRDREKAADALLAIRSNISAVGAAATKGEMKFSDDVIAAIDYYNDLDTVFKESRYRDDIL